MKTNDIMHKVEELVDDAVGDVFYSLTKELELENGDISPSMEEDLECLKHKTSLLVRDWAIDNLHTRTIRVLVNDHEYNRLIRAEVVVHASKLEYTPYNTEILNTVWRGLCAQTGEVVPNLDARFCSVVILNNEVKEITIEEKIQF